jgi:putative nucleotidyltransferase with HDIG domain
MLATGKTGPVGVQERLAAQLESIVTKRIASDQLVLPSMPAVAAKTLALTKDPDFSLKTAAALIEKDPSMAAQLIKLASSAAMGSRDGIKSVLAAVTRLGVQKLKLFLIESAARKMFESRDPRISEATKGLWEHSLGVAMLARDVVAFSNSGDPDLGYLAGLLHDIGKPVVAALLLETEKSVLGAKATAIWISGPEWIGVIQRCHQRVGVALAEKWELPEPVGRAIRDCTDYDNTDRLSIANSVRFANALAKQQGLYVGDVDKDDVDALVMIGRSLLNLDDAIVSRLTGGIKALVRDTLA